MARMLSIIQEFGSRDMRAAIVNGNVATIETIYRKVVGQ